MRNILDSLKYYEKNNLAFYFWLFFSSLVSGLVPVLYVYIPKLILDELLGAHRPEILWQLVAFLAISGLAFSLFRNYAAMRFETFSFDLIYFLTEKVAARRSQFRIRKVRAKLSWTRKNVPLAVWITFGS